MTEPTPTPSPEARQSLEALRVAVREELERKRRLGQHAVVWRNGRVETLDWHDERGNQAE